MSSGVFTSRAPSPAGALLPADVGPTRRGAAATDATTDNGKSFVQMLSEGAPLRVAAPVLPPIAPQDPGKQATLARRPSVTSAEPGLREVAARALDAEKRFDALMASVAQGRTFSAAELIALQASVFRYSQTVEIISRATDRLLGAIKQTLSTQV